MLTIKRFALFLMTACLVTGIASANDARVRVIHASPDAPAVDILVNDDLRAFQNVAFGEASDYTPVPANVYNAKVVPAGAGPGSAVIDADLNLFYKTDYTVIAVDFLDDITPIVLMDDNSLLSFRESRVRFVHASPDAPAVDIKIQDGPYLFQDVEFKESAGYVTVPRGMYNLEVRVAGTDVVALEIPAVMLDRGAIYTVVATGLVNGTPGLDVILAEDTNRLRSSAPFWRYRR